MNLADEKTWKVVRAWLIGVCCGAVCFVGFGVTMAVFVAHTGVAERENGMVGGAAVFWPIGLPAGLAIWYPLPTLLVTIALVGGATLAVLRIRRRQLALIEDERLLREAGL